MSKQEKREKEEKEREFLRVREVAKRLRLSSVTVRKMIKEGYLSGIRLGKRTLRVDKGDLEDYISQQRLESPYKDKQ